MLFFQGLTLATLISRILVLLIAFTVHEFAHAWTATRFGDPTPEMNGRLTLNPVAHLDPIGSLLLLISGFGWAKPVPINPYVLNRRSHSAVMWVSLAGPLSNFLMAIVGGILFRLVMLSPALAFAGSNQRILPTIPEFLLEFIAINLVLMLFNLIPLAPLDGDKIFGHFLPFEWQQTLDNIRPYGPLILMAIIFILPMFGLDVVGWLINRPLTYLMNLLIR
jgi:Zn-dependent protease